MNSSSMANRFGELLPSRMRYSLAVLLNTPRIASRLRLAFHPNMLAIILLTIGVILISLPAHAFAKEQGMPSLERKIQILKEAKKRDSTNNKVLELKKNILYDIFDLAIDEDENIGRKLVDTRLATSTQNMFLESLWESEQWYLGKRVETSRATSTSALTSITKEIKKYRQEVQGMLHNKISGIILIDDAEYALNTTEERLGQIIKDLSNAPERETNTLLRTYSTKIKEQLEEVRTSVQDTKEIFEKLSSRKDYEIGMKRLSYINSIIQLIYEEFAAMGRLTGNPLFPQETKDKSSDKAQDKPLGLENTPSFQNQI